MGNNYITYKQKIWSTCKKNELNIYIKGNRKRIQYQLVVEKIQDLRKGAIVLKKYNINSNFDHSLHGFDCK